MIRQPSNTTLFWMAARTSGGPRLVAGSRQDHRGRAEQGEAGPDVARREAHVDVAGAVGDRVDREVEDADVERAAEAAGAQSLEACMASSIPQAREGTLYLMVGGRKEAFDKAEPVLQKMSGSLRYIGKSGEAAKVKALVNMVMNINTAGLAEGLGLGDALGLDLTMLREIFAQTGANSRVLETDGADMQNRDHDCYFSAAHAAKDSGIALSLARGAGLEVPLAAATKRQFDTMVDRGIGELDKSGIAELTFKSRRAPTLART